MKLLLLLIASTLCSLSADGQYNSNRNKMWAFGTFGGINFNTSPPSVFSSNINTTEGCAAVSDESGNLLFYTNGTIVYNRLGSVMPNGSSIVPSTTPSWGTSSTTQAAVIVPVIGNPNQYYVFSMGSVVIAPNYCPLAYCIVDMALASGLGDVIPSSMGTFLNNFLGEKIIAIPGNDCNIWILTHRRDTSRFLAYEITAAGINLTPVISTSGTTIAAEAYSQGQIKASHDRLKICVQASGKQLTELHDFNPSTGVVSNCRVLSSMTGNQYGAEFSPDNTKLYTQQFNPLPNTSSLTQYDISLPTTAAIISSATNLVTRPGYFYSSLQLAPDDKIYFSSFNGGTGFLDRITSPNLAGIACAFTPNIVALLPGAMTQLGMQNAVASVLPADSTYTHHDTTLCILPGGVPIYPHASGAGYLWNDGTTTPADTINAPGTYWVAIINGCSVQIDTIHVVNGSSTPAPDITGDTLYCFGQSFSPFTITGINVLWYTAPTAVGSVAQPAINTTIPGTYTVYATQTIGCVSPMDSIVVTVLPRISPSFSWLVDHGCISDTVYFTNIPTAASNYTWNFGDGSLVDTGSTDLVHGYATHGSYSVTLTARNYAGCINDTTIVVDANYPISANFTAIPDTFCAGGATTLTMTTAAIALTSISWNFGDNTTETSNPTPIHSYADGGTYPVTLSVTDTAGCHDSVTKRVVVLEIEISMPHDTMLCVSYQLPLINDVTMIPPIVAENYTYTWSPNTHLNDTTWQTPLFSGLGQTTYTFTATLQPWGCTATDTIHVHSIPGTKLTNVTSSTTIPFGSSMQLYAGNEIYYMWTPNNGSLDNPNINNPIATPAATTLYTVYGYDEYGCQDSAFVHIIVDSTMTECIPNAFTPNQDGRNDVFRPLCITFQDLVEFRIYNRWGENVFYSASMGKGWDGSYNGCPQDAGTYNYMIVIERLGKQTIYKGTVTLIR